MHPVEKSAAVVEADTAASREASLQAGHRIAAAIPARLGSTRLPGKVLLEIDGRPMIEHVYRRVRAASGLDRVVVLTDSERVADAVAAFGGECELTPEECASGTDRIAWAAKHWPQEAVLNVQGDEPLIDPEDISRLARHLREHPEDQIVTLSARTSAEAADDPDSVKVVTDRQGYALYFSRSRIPFQRAGSGEEQAAPRQHLGIYGYQRRTLLELAQLERTPLEMSESLEQLRALEHGIRIRVLEIQHAPPSVDTARDLEHVRTLIQDGASSPTSHGA